MTLKNKIVVACAAAAMVITMSAANAQAPMPAMPGAPGMPSPAPMAAPAPMGGAMSTTQTTQTTTTEADPYAIESTETLPDTGGEPLLMMMAGTLLAGSAFAMRRKLS